MCSHCGILPCFILIWVDQYAQRAIITISRYTKLRTFNRRAVDIVMENRGEGLILKHPGSEYVLNGRTKDWIKVKPEYMDNMGETVDVLVVGANFGSGKRSGGASTLICAVLDDRRNMNDDDEIRSAAHSK